MGRKVEEEEGPNLMHQAGQQIFKVEQEAVVVVGIFMSMTTAIRPTTDGYHTQRISLGVWKLIPRADLLMEMGDIRIRERIGSLLGKDGKE